MQKLKNTLILTILFFSTNIIYTQNYTFQTPSKPRLIVTILVDQMSMDQLNRYWNRLSDNGFKKLANLGVVYKDTRIPYFFTQNVCGYASISTGAVPSDHGIIGEKWYNALRDQIVFSTCDNLSSPEDSKDGPSPRWLISSDIGDELRLNNKQSKVIGVSLSNKGAILTAGHSSNASFWFDENFGTWITSKYYMDSVPRWVREFNNKRLLDIYLNRDWSPLLPLNQYTESMLDNNPYETGIGNQITFPYNLEALRKKFGYRILSGIPAGNTYIKDFALAAIAGEKLGKDENTDLLYVVFDANNTLANNFGGRSVEMEDAFLRLDLDLAHFIAYLDETIGNDKVLICLTSVGGASENPQYLTDNKIPAGYFKSNQAIYLLKSYLYAKYNNKELIKYYQHQQIYLDHKVIEDSKLSLNEIEDNCSDFLRQFSGVSDAIPSYVIRSNSYRGGSLEKLKNSYNASRSGDVLIVLEPNWIEQVDQHNSQDYNQHVPLIWYGWRLKPAFVTRSVSTTDIVPTLVGILNLPLPNAAFGNALLEIYR